LTKQVAATAVFLGFLDGSLCRLAGSANSAPDGAGLEQRAGLPTFRFLVLEKFFDESSCDQLRAQAEKLVQNFDPAEAVFIFSTHEQNRFTDDYFLSSGEVQVLILTMKGVYWRGRQGMVCARYISKA